MKPTSWRTGDRCRSFQRRALTLLGSAFERFQGLLDRVANDGRLFFARCVESIELALDGRRHLVVPGDDQQRQREHGRQMREEMRRADAEFGGIAPEARQFDRVDIPDQDRVETAEQDGQADGRDDGLNEIDRHRRQHARERGAHAKRVDLAGGDLISADEGLELPGHDPIEQADADGEGRVVEREQDVAEAQQVAAGFAGIAFGRLRLQRLALERRLSAAARGRPARPARPGRRPCRPPWCCA